MAEQPAHQGSGDARARTPIDWRRLHLWQIQPVRDILGVLLIIGLVKLGYEIRVVTVPLLLAFLLAYLVEPVVRKLTRRGRMTRKGAVTSVLVAVILFIIVPATIATSFAVVQLAGAVTAVARNAQALLLSVEGATPEERGRGYDALEGQAWRDLSHILREARQQDQKEVEEERPLPPEGAITPPALAEAAARAKALADEAETPEGEGFVAVILPPERRQELSATITMAIDWIGANADAIAQSLSKRAIGTGADALSFAARTLGSIGYVLFTLFLTAFFFFFISTGYGRVLDFWQSLIPERKKGLAIDLAAKMNVAVSGFVRGRLTIALIQSVVFSVGYLLIGVPGWLILGPLVALLSIVPYAALIGVPISIVLLYLEQNRLPFQDTWWWTLFAPLGIYFGGQTLDDYVLTPAIQGRSTGMDTPTILFASLAGGALAGVYGLLIAIPVAACIKIVLQELFWPRFKRWAEGKERDFLPIQD